MLKNYSWSDYLVAIAALTAIYYVIIAVLFYHSEIINVFTGKIRLKYKRKTDTPETDSQEYGEEGSRGVKELEEVMGDVRSSVLVQAGEQATKQELLMQLKHKLANYGGLRRPAYRLAVNNFIIEHAKDICGVTFSEGELDEQWGPLPR